MTGPCQVELTASSPVLQPSTLQRPPAHYGGFGFRGPPPSDGPGLTVDVDQLQKDIERAQVGLGVCVGASFAASRLMALPGDEQRDGAVRA